MRKTREKNILGYKIKERIVKPYKWNSIRLLTTSVNLLPERKAARAQLPVAIQDLVYPHVLDDRGEELITGTRCIRGGPAWKERNGKEAERRRVVARHFANSIEHTLFTVSRLTTAFQKRRSVSRILYRRIRRIVARELYSRDFYFMNNLPRKKLNFSTIRTRESNKSSVCLVQKFVHWERCKNNFRGIF